MARSDNRQEQLSFLQFWFFKHGGATPIKLKLPFIENIDIKESQKANYVKYQPIGRAGSLFTYTGAESRKLRLSFNFTFDNVGVYMPSQLQNYTAEDLYSEDPFFSQVNAINSDAYTQFSKIDRERDDISKDDEVVQIIMYWVNLIRSSTLNNVDDPTLPPPLIRLTHGTMYRNVPCVCHGYSLSYEENAGYERASFLPRRVKVTMDLSEVRLNQILTNTTKETSILNSATYETTDKLKGWETIIKGGSLDPVKTLSGEESIKEPLPLGATDLGNLA